MQARMTHPVFLIPEAMKGLQAYGNSASDLGVSRTTLEMLNLRASQINGCSVCVEMHAAALKKAGEPDEKIVTVAAWRDAPHFTDAERAALALTESMTRIADNPDGVPDEIWAEAARHFDEKGMAALVISISTINVWNRLNVATRQVSGQWKA